MLNTSARIPVCDLISPYNATALPEGPDRVNLLLGAILRTQMGNWVTQGKVRYREEMIDGLEQAPAAFVGLLKGEAFGKRVIKLSA